MKIKEIIDKKIAEIKKNKKITITQEEYDDLNRQIKEAENGTRRENKEKIEIRKSYDSYKETTSNLIQKKDLEINTLKKENKLQKQVIDEFPSKLKRTLDAQKGGHTKELNKWKKKCDAKDKVIEEYKLALQKSEKKNDIQAAKIRELSAKQEHTAEEYQNDGLPKQSKAALKNKRKKEEI